MRPVVEADTLFINQAIKRCVVVGPKTAPQRQVVSAIEHVDAVQLKPAGLFQVLPQVVATQLNATARLGKSLSVQPPTNNGLSVEGEWRLRHRSSLALNSQT